MCPRKLFLSYAKTNVVEVFSLEAECEPSGTNFDNLTLCFLYLPHQQQLLNRVNIWWDIFNRKWFASCVDLITALIYFNLWFIKNRVSSRPAVTLSVLHLALSIICINTVLLFRSWSKFLVQLFYVLITPSSLSDNRLSFKWDGLE